MMTSEPRRPGTIGRTLRLVNGVVFLAIVLSVLATNYWTLALWVVGVSAGLLICYLGLDYAVNRFVPEIDCCVGAFLALGPAIGVFVVGNGIGELGALTYIGLSLIVAAWRADAGCEVMSLPGLISGRHTHLACLVFTPIDRLEHRLRTTRADG